MTKASETKVSHSVIKTSALENFESNLDQINIFLRRLDPNQIKKAILKAQKMVAKEAKSAPAVDMNKIARGLGTTFALVQDYEAFRTPAL
jgi:hypothetical protein